ncbi:MAG: ABC transporter permease [Gammaproteobacteria bacterium]
MRRALYLGWRYLAHHQFKSGVLIASVTLMLFLPAATRLLVEDSATALTARADQTPLILGARGSELELVLNTLYFHAESPAEIEHRVLTEARSTGFAKFIPVHSRFRAQGAPIVGTTPDYFAFRNLKIADGRPLGLLGECVIGANAAARMGLGAGDSVISSPETVFDIAGVYPLKMRIAGVLAASGTADDDAVFVDVRTSWIIQGLGHGHADLAKPEEGAAVLSRREDMVTANASLTQYAEITRDNISAFHFHGSDDTFPLTSIIGVPPDQKSAALLRGRYQDNDLLQLVVPGRVLEDLLATVFAVQNYVILGLAILSLATIAVITLVFLLSQQLRKGEFRTLSRIGAPQGYIWVLIASEIGFVFLISALLAATLTIITRYFAMQILQTFLTL